MAHQLENGGIVFYLKNTTENHPAAIRSLLCDFLTSQSDMGTYTLSQDKRDICGKWVYLGKIGEFIIIFTSKKLANGGYILDTAIENKHATLNVCAFVLQNLRNSMTEFFTRKGV